MKKRPQLGKVIGYHALLSGSNDNHSFLRSFQELVDLKDRNKDKHLDIFVLVQTSYGDLKIQKMSFNDVPQINSPLLSDASNECVWRPATDKDVSNYHHNYSES